MSRRFLINFNQHKKEHQAPFQTKKEVSDDKLHYRSTQRYQQLHKQNTKSELNTVITGKLQAKPRKSKSTILINIRNIRVSKLRFIGYLDQNGFRI